jgi:oxygen-independent coproporphyrinogen-3 oxidase
MERVLKEEINRLEYYLSILEPGSVETCYIGGGTPTVVPLEILYTFLEKIFRLLPNIPLEVTIEANPESLSLPFLELIQTFPINRLSVGIQTFQDKFLNNLHRISSGTINRKALELIHSYWKGNLNVDILYGFPGSTVQEAEKDKEEIAQFMPHHLSLYCLTPEPGTRYEQYLREGRLTPLSFTQEEAIRRFWHRWLKEEGYVHYEISNFSLPSYECRHNLRYWRLEPYLGIGPSAVSTLPGTEGRIIRMTEWRDVEQYGGSFSSTVSLEYLSPVTFLKDYFLMGLRPLQGIEEAEFSRIFSFPPEKIIPRTLEKYKKYFRFKNGYVFLNSSGRLIMNRILVDIFLEIDDISVPIPCAWPNS